MENMSGLVLARAESTDDAAANGFLAYHEPTGRTSSSPQTRKERGRFFLSTGFCIDYMLTTAPVIPLLTLISFLFFLSFSDWLAGVILRAGLIGQIIVGLIYGVPIGNILPLDWQETFIALGYLGLILIVFEGRQRRPSRANRCI